MIPWVREWYDEFEGEDFQIVGVHYPEFGYEEKYENVVDAVARFEIRYPVALDNDGRTWRAYRQRFWPTRYLIDRDGNIRYKHIGEGAYEETRAAIAHLLTE